MAELRIAGGTYNGSPFAVSPVVSLASLQPVAQARMSSFQLAQADKPKRPSDSRTWTKEQWKEAIEEYSKRKAEDPNNLKNFGKTILGMNSDESIKQLGLIGVAAESPSAMKSALAPLDAIATVTGVTSPASIGSNWEQKTAFMTLWVRQTTNNVAAATQGIQVVNQLYQARTITANEARLRVAGYTLKAQTESAKLNTFGTALGQLNLKLGKTEGGLAMANLKLQVQQNQLAIKTALGTASTNLDTIDKTVANQASGVRNSAVANIQQFDNLRLQALGKIRSVAPEPRATGANPNGGVLEYDSKTGAALPMVPNGSAYLSTDQTRALVNSVMPVIKNGKPAELANSPAPGVGTSPSEVSGVASAERAKLRTATADLRQFASLSEPQFKAKFGATRAQAQKELNEIRSNIPVPVDTKTLRAATSKTAPAIDEAGELAAMKTAARTATDLKPAFKNFIESLNVKTKAQYEYTVGVALINAGLKFVGTAFEIRQLGRRATQGAGSAPGAKGAEAAKSVQKFLPEASLSSLNNLYGQLARNKNLEQTVRAYALTVESQRLAGVGLDLTRGSYLQAVKALGQGVEQNKVAVASYQTNVKGVQTQLDTVQARLSTLGTNDSRLTAAKESFDIAKRVGQISTQTATINNKVAAQSGRITAVTGANNTFIASLNNVVSAGQDYNLRPLARAFVQAPTAIVVTDKGLVVQQKFLYAAYAEVRAKSGGDADRVRYDTPAVLSLARAKTHQDFKAAYPSAAAVLLADKPNSVSLSAINILRDGKYDAARTLMPANLKAAPPVTYALPNVPTRLAWGSGAVPASVSATPIPVPQFERIPGTTQQDEDRILHGESGVSNTEAPSKRQ
jgi:hypothetical protein